MLFQAILNVSPIRLAPLSHLCHMTSPGVTLKMNSGNLGRFAGSEHSFVDAERNAAIASANSRLVYLTSEKLEKNGFKKPQKASYAKLLTVTPDALYIF